MFESATKEGATHGAVNGRKAALKLYGAEDERYRRYTVADLEYISRTIDADLLAFFYYSPNISTAGRHVP